MASEKKREEAENLMKIAETKFESNDVNGAKETALRAKKLFPSLPGLKQSLAAYEVHIAAAASAGGRVDWKAVLGVGAGVDAKVVKQQFHRMCKLTHPDKNPSAAADGAFKLVMEAFEKLSIKTGSSEGNSKNSEDNVPSNGAKRHRNKKKENSKNTDENVPNNGADNHHNKNKDDSNSKKKKEEEKRDDYDPSSGKGKERNFSSAPPPAAAESTGNRRTEKKCNQELARVECPRCGKLCKRRVIREHIFIRCKHAGILGGDANRYEYFYVVFAGDNILYRPLKFGAQF